MAKLTFWIAEQHDDSDCYNLVARTRKDLIAKVRDYTGKDQYPTNAHQGRHDAPKKVVVEYKDAFDLFDLLTSESGGRHSHL